MNNFKIFAFELLFSWKEQVIHICEVESFVPFSFICFQYLLVNTCFRLVLGMNSLYKECVGFFGFTKIINQKARTWNMLSF